MVIKLSKQAVCIGTWANYSSTSQEITPVLHRRLLQYFVGDYSSTWPRLLQYLMEITAVLGPSTGAKYWRTDFEGEPYSCCLEFQRTVIIIKLSKNNNKSVIKIIIMKNKYYHLFLVKIILFIYLSEPIIALKTLIDIKY